MNIDKLIKEHQNDIPNYKLDLDNCFEIALPSFNLTVDILLEKDRPLTVLEIFVLRAVNVGISNAGEVCNVLGIIDSKKTAVLTIVNQFQKGGYIEVNSGRLALSDQGKELLKVLQIPKLKEWTLKCCWDAITGEYYQHYGLHDELTLKQDGIHIVNSYLFLDEERLSNDIVELKDVWKAQNMPWLGELSRIEELRPLRSRPSYRRMGLLTFIPHYSGDTIFQVYHDDKNRSSSHEAALQDMLRDGVPIFPETSNFVAKNATESYIKIIPTAEHPQWLFKTLHRKDCKQIVIFSGWISSSVVDEHLKHLIENAVARGTRILIGYGYDEKDNLPPKQREEEDKALAIFREIRQQQNGGQNLKLYRFRQRGQHAKILICDYEYMIVSSFNWLSFSGKPDIYGRERIEYGILIEDEGAIKNMLDELLFLIENEGYDPMIIS